MYRIISWGQSAPLEKHEIRVATFDSVTEMLLPLEVPEKKYKTNDDKRTK